MTRFVAVWTLQRGALEKPEPLDDANQWRAFSAWRMDASREARAAFELGETVVWNHDLPWDLRKPIERVTSETRKVRII